MPTYLVSVCPPNDEEAELLNRVIRKAVISDSLQRPSPRIWTFARGHDSIEEIHDRIKSAWPIPRRRHPIPHRPLPRRPFLVAPTEGQWFTGRSAHPLDSYLQVDTVVMMAPGLSGMASRQKQLDADIEREFEVNQPEPLALKCHVMAMTWAMQGDGDVGRRVFAILADSDMVERQDSTVIVPISDQWAAGNRALAANKCFNW